MFEIDRGALDEVETAFQRYKAAVEASALQSSTKRTYLLHSENFIRWLRGEFKPGRTLTEGAGSHGLKGQRPRYRFRGNWDEFVEGLPPHDLYEEDMKALSAEQKALLDAHLRTPSPLYEAGESAGRRRPMRRSQRWHY